MLAAFMNCISGALSFGIQPAIGAQFVVYFCNLPLKMSLAGVTMPTFAVVMVLLLAISLFMTLTGGQISVMMTDCIEGIVSGIFYLVVAVSVLWVVSYAQMQHVLLSGPPGESLINPLDTSKRADFNITFSLLLIGMRVFIYRGNAWQAGFAASARNPHEGQMAGILTTLKHVTSGMMAWLIAIGALVVLHHVDFSGKAALVAQKLAAIPASQRSSMRMPIALSLLLPMGAKGALCAIALFGMLAGLGGQMHAFGGTFIQDVILPLRKTPLDPKRQIRWLRMAAIGVALFGVVFGLFFSMPDYLIFVTQLFGAMYLCIGAVVWGGLYWKKGTNAGAWASMTGGIVLAMAGLLLSTYWTSGLQRMLVSSSQAVGWVSAAASLAKHPDKCPINMQVLTVISYAGAGIVYVVVSLLTCRTNFNLDKMLHRGPYRVPELPSHGHKVGTTPSFLEKVFRITNEYSRGDKIIAVVSTLWVLTWCFAGIGILGWNFFVRRWTNLQWFHYIFFKEIWVSMVAGFVVTAWFTIGGIRDILDLFRALKVVKQDDRDNGMVDQGEPGPPEVLTPVVEEFDEPEVVERSSNF
jgi:solute:Na+ symporter, SSS family